jgi:hypothetical protein
MLTAGYAHLGSYFRETKHVPDGVRRRCLSDPEVMNDIRKRARETAEKQKDHGVFAVGIADEAFLSSRHERTEFCFSPHCTARYREWLQARYKTLAAVNAQWGTGYGAWDEIKGARTEEGIHGCSVPDRETEALVFVQQVQGTRNGPGSSRQGLVRVSQAGKTKVGQRYCENRGRGHARFFRKKEPGPGTAAPGSRFRVTKRVQQDTAPMVQCKAKCGRCAVAPGRIRIRPPGRSGPRGRRSTG